MARHFAREADGWVDRYATRRSFRQRLRVVAEVVEPLLRAVPNPAVLDFGGGPGIFAMLAAEAGGPVVDLDPSWPMVRAGRRAAPRMARIVAGATGATAPGLRRPHWVAGTLDALGPGADRRFDVVLAIAVLEYVDDPCATLDRLGRLLRRRGALVLTVPRARSAARRAERALARAAARLHAAAPALAALDRDYRALRPHGDAVPWPQAAAAAGLTVTSRRPVPLGDRLPWSLARPNEVVVLRPAAQPVRRPTGPRPVAVPPAIRSLAEQATRRLVLRRRLSAPYQRTRLYVSSEAGLKYLRPTLTHVDPVLTALVRETVRPGSVVWDIGADVGLFSFAAATAAGAGGHVLAVEPDTWLVGLLRRSAALPGDRAPVEILATAIGEATGVARFHVATRNRETSHLAGFGHRADVRAVLPVPTLTLDALLAHTPAPDVLKIDVEGAELLVLRGARHLLATARPILICDVAEANARPVRALLAEHGYRVLDGELPPAHRAPLPAAPRTTLALPVGATPATATPRQPTARTALVTD
jgi:FkbM family methyltransferase